MKRSWIFLVAVGVLVTLVDQATKFLILSRFEAGEVVAVIPGLFNLTLHYNYGAAFGIFGGLSEGVRELVLGGAKLLALGVVLYLLTVPQYQGTVPRSGLAMILGGAFGNIIDRFVHGAVVDFLDFYLGTYHWPTFNIADSAIFCGVALLIGSDLFSSRVDNKVSSSPQREIAG